MTDLDMPDLGGEELLRRVRSDPALASIPVVAVSGSRTDQPFDLFVPKPFAGADVRDALRLAARGDDLEAGEAIAVLLPPLDGRPGPAQRLSQAARATIVRRIARDVSQAMGC